MILLYESGGTVAEICESFDTTAKTVYKYLKLRRGYVQPAVTAFQRDIMAQMYQRGKTIAEIAKRFDASKQTVYAQLRKARALSEKTTKLHPLLHPEATPSDVASAYSKGYSVAELATEFNISKSTVYDRLFRAGITPDKRNPPRPRKRVHKGRMVGSKPHKKLED